MLEAPKESSGNNLNISEIQLGSQNDCARE